MLKKGKIHVFRKAQGLRERREFENKEDDCLIFTAMGLSSAVGGIE